MAVSAVIAGASFASEARAYSIQIDCYGTNGVPTWDATNNTITIETKINNVWSVLCTRKADGCTSDNDITKIENPNENTCTNPNFTAAQVQQVRFSTNGDDAWFLDEWQLYDNSVRYFYGTDNNTGWCFSTQASDGNSQHCLGGVSYTSKTWSGGS